MSPQLENIFIISADFLRIFCAKFKPKYILVQGLFVFFVNLVNTKKLTFFKAKYLVGCYLGDFNTPPQALICIYVSGPQCHFSG